MTYVYTVAQVRAAEQQLIDAQSAPDQLMRQAAHIVAVAARTMCEPSDDGRVLLLVGAGGNGGDALYAGAELCNTHRVDAVLLGRFGRVHERALEAFTSAGGTVLDALPSDLRPFRLVIDGIVGIGGSGGLGENLAHWLSDAEEFSLPILSVDVPSGVDTDYGSVPASAVPLNFTHGKTLGRPIPQHVRADVTVTFGGLRRAHAVSPACGEVIYADLRCEGRSLAQALWTTARQEEQQPLLAWRAAPADQFNWPEPLRTLMPSHLRSLEPRPDDDKYSGGVVGICAGSAAYPGAGYLATSAAVRSTPSMVRYVGPLKDDIVRALPEVVISESVSKTGHVQAWVVGPGRGTDAVAEAELAELLGCPEPVVIDADALTLLSKSAQLRTLLRSRPANTLLTPHLGEFRRLADSLEADIPDPEVDRIGAVLALARNLECDVLLKGRHTVIASPLGHVNSVDAGSSWGATAGSGDVLAGILGALMASSHAQAMASVGASIHSIAAWLSAQTPYGPAPTSASRIAEAIPHATAYLTNP
ncbi:Bifunctional NAD(P)H-hydrate repair enzyme Nnr [Corynebacterium atrinae]|uniref:bifunctional ADP-dependent NAD(P)H-hydrate dehydratase/NAD(P)H-hydrate epimerase n=1 Tax=Corynebacterium atrinae TaxID=1336740 RepID=UPI0025B44EE7|nr:bifunctional ADP-dependent NAD(P)H-hydrate dehydratase/NAD(P)H-hydrate epimerase [Corynebacterium atrinae]WJY64629.1 Bifunctional NAD(P)H-hydrate repair enzyme Nnr [Corynebacterium atrinae]